MKMDNMALWGKVSYKVGLDGELSTTSNRVLIVLFTFGLFFFASSIVVHRHGSVNENIVAAVLPVALRHLY